MLLFPVINFKLQVFIITQEQIFLTGDFGFLKEKRNELQNGKTCGSVKRLYWSFPYQLQSVETSIRPLPSGRKGLVLTSLLFGCTKVNKVQPAEAKILLARACTKIVMNL